MNRIILLTIVAIVGIVQVANGQIVDESTRATFGLVLEMGTVVDYCFEHADSPNPVQDLFDKGLISPTFNGKTCGEVKIAYENIMNIIRNGLLTR
ncbi:MAG: hypothetical protein ABR515_02645 [Nitrososphaeraceae archaeon]